MILQTTLAATAQALAHTARQGIARDPAGKVVKIGRGLYITSAGFLGLALYTGWRNQRVKPGSAEIPIPGLTKKKAKYSPSRDDVPLPSSPQSGAPGGGTGVSTNVPFESEAYDERKWNIRNHEMAKLAQRFGLVISSSKRTPAENAAANGVPDSLHLVTNGALAWDLSTPGAPQVTANERRCYEFCKPLEGTVFQEVMIHNAGSGYHVHLAFRKGVTRIPSGSGVGVMN